MLGFSNGQKSPEVQGTKNCKTNGSSLTPRFFYGSCQLVFVPQICPGILKPLGLYYDVGINAVAKPFKKDR